MLRVAVVQRGQHEETQAEGTERLVCVMQEYKALMDKHGPSAEKVRAKVRHALATPFDCTGLELVHAACSLILPVMKRSVSHNNSPRLETTYDTALLLVCIHCCCLCCCYW